MSYTPPSGDAAQLDFLSGYVPQSGDAAALDFGGAGELIQVESGVELVTLIVERAEAGCELRTVVLSAAIETGCEVALVVAAAQVEVAVECWRPHSVEAVTLVLRGDTAPVSVAVSVVRRAGVAVERGTLIHRQEWLELGSGISMVLDMAAALVEAGCVIGCEHAALTPLEVGCVLVALDASAPALHQVVSLPVVMAGGVALTSLSGLSLRASRDAHAVTGSLELLDAGEWSGLAAGDAISLTLAGRAVALRVADRKRSRNHGDWRYTVEVESPSSWLDAPHAAPLTAATLSGRASVLAASLAGSIPLAWSAVDWTIPTDGLPAAGQTPLSLLRALAAAPGAICCSNWDGSLLVAPEYPRAVPTWSTAAPDLIIRESASVLSADDDDDWRGGYNAYLLGAAAAGAENTGDLRLEVADNDDGSKTIRAASVPWDGSLALSHRGGPWVQLSLLGDQTRTETETVQIVDGVGRCRYPVQAILARDWLEHELGALTAAADGQLTSATVGDSLVSVSYTTRARVWTILDPHDEEVMVVAETAGAAAGAGVSVLVTRGSGDRRGEDVVDPLLTAEPVARERGRNLIDAASTRRQIVTLTCPFTALHDHGSLVEVREAADGPWRGMLRGQEVALAVGDDGTPTWDTVLTIERESC